MPPAKRNSNKHLPPNVYHKYGAYYYVSNVNKKRKWYRLGESLSEAMNEWTKIVNCNDRIITMNQLFNRYMVEVAPTKSPASYRQNQIQIQNLRLFFGDVSPGDVTAVDIYKYLDIRGKKSKVAPNREKALLSHCFTMAIRWGIAKENPCRFVKRLTERPRDRYINDEEYLAVKSIATPVLQCLMDFAYLTAQRISDILKITVSELTEEGIKIQQNKTGSKLIIQWSDALSELVTKIKRLPRSNLTSLTLFCNRRGQKMTYDSFKTIWGRTMKKALQSGLIETPFTFHDIRAKSASDAKNKADASALLGHADMRITERIYNRKANVVRPIK